MGSLNYEMPVDPVSLNKIHAAYPSIEALESGLLQPALNQTIFLTGQLMSSHESYQERRTQIVQYVEDQVQNGIYQTRSRTENVQDAATQETRQVRVSEIVIGPTGQPLRSGGGEVGRFKVRTYNFAISDLDYSTTVDEQIAKQQAITMAVQTAIAKAREAQQNEITAGAEGRANAEREKQTQNAINAKVIAEAEGRKLAAEQDKLAASSEKEASILRAQGQAEARRLVMAADNALDARLGALVQIHQAWAGAAAQVKVPNTVMGSASGANPVGNMQDYMAIMAAKAVKDIDAAAGKN
jgi:regulator of protease activity HflC (stomatin/prohibitin superfamily)